jgi:hypothetical protein
MAEPIQGGGAEQLIGEGIPVDLLVKVTQSKLINH